MVCETNTVISSVSSMLQHRQSSRMLPKQAVLYSLCTRWVTGTQATKPRHSAELLLLLYPLVIMFISTFISAYLFPCIIT